VTQKKLCMIGAFAVGKTSLVQRYVYSIFSDRYLTTVGVKIDRKTLTLDGSELTLLLWDLAGEDDFQSIRMSYLRGSSGYLLVADGTRRATLDAAIRLQHAVHGEIGTVPFTLLLNKADLEDSWEVEPERLAALQAQGWVLRPTSAKTGHGVEEAFRDLAARLGTPR
jgi:hypothetical protein